MAQLQLTQTRAMRWLKRSQQATPAELTALQQMLSQDGMPTAAWTPAADSATTKLLLLMAAPENRLPA